MKKQCVRLLSSTCCLILLLLLCACSANTGSAGSQSQSAASTIPATLTALSTTSGAHTGSSKPTPAASQGYAVKVYFSKSPQSDQNYSTVFPVTRFSPTTGVATYAMQQLINGPSTTEKDLGYVSQVHNMIHGPSNCGGADFQLTLNVKGTTPQPGTATLKFCRSVSNQTDALLADGQMRAEINATLSQFPTIKKVVVLEDTGHCFADESGEDLCLR